MWGLLRDPASSQTFFFFVLPQFCLSLKLIFLSRYLSLFKPFPLVAFDSFCQKNPILEATKAANAA